MLGKGRRCEFSQEFLVTTLFDLKKYLPGYARKKLKEQYGNLAKQVSKQGNDKRGNLRARKPFAWKEMGKQDSYCQYIPIRPKRLAFRLLVNHPTRL